MKAPAPPPPKGCSQATGQENVLSKFTAIVYVHEDKTWKPLYDKYTTLLCCDNAGEELNERYSLNTYVGEQRILEYFITASTKVKIKESFVRCQNDRLIVGARFKSEEVAQNYHQQLTEILSEICPYAKVNKHPKKSKEAAVAVVENPQPAVKETRRQPSVIQQDIPSMVSIAPKRENSLVENGVSTFAPGPYEKRRESNTKKDQINYDYRRGSASVIKKDPQKQAPVSEVRRGSASSVNIGVKKETEIRRDSNSSNNSAGTRRDSNNVSNSYNVRRESAPVTMMTDAGGRRDIGSLSKAATKTQRSVIDEKQPQLSDTDDPLWKVFLGLANLQSAELSNPRVASVVKKFVLERGGDTFLRQVSDQKLSSRLVDDLNSLAGQVHAITEQPVVAHKPPVKPERPSSASRQISQPAPAIPTTEATAAGGTATETSTLDRRAKKKRRAAPPPPVRSKSLQNLVDEDEKSPAEKIEFERTATVSGKPSGAMTSPVGKRKAPAAPPIKASPPNTMKDKIQHDTSYPNFVAPPPPSGPPPDESIGSPVGPLSPESAGVPTFTSPKEDNVTKDDVTTAKAELTEEQKNAVAQLDMVICAEEEILDENDESDDVFVTKTENKDPGTPTIKRNENQQIVGKVIILPSDEADGKLEPLNVETTQIVKKEETHVDVPAPSPPPNDTQLLLQQQLMALQAQVSQQEQMLLAAGLLKKKEDVVVVEKPPSKPATPATTPPGTVKTKIEITESTTTVETKKSAVIVPPRQTVETKTTPKPVIVVVEKKVEEKAVVKTAPPPVASKPPPVATKPRPAVAAVPVAAVPVAVLVVKQEKPAPPPSEPLLPPAPAPVEPVADACFEIELDLPPPPPELLEDTIIASPVSSPPQERYERIITLSPKESSTPVANKEKSKDLDTSLKNTVKELPKPVEVETSKPVVVMPEVTTPPPTPVSAPITVSTSPPETPKLTPQTSPKSSSPSPDGASKYSVVAAGGIGGKKPMSGLYAKLKARTAAKGGKMPISTSAASTAPKTPQLPPPVVKQVPKPADTSANAAQSSVKSVAAAPVVSAAAPSKTEVKSSPPTSPPVGLGSIINSEPVTVTRKEQLKISNPSTLGKKEPLKISEPIQKEPVVVACGPKSVGVVPCTKNETESKALPVQSKAASKINGNDISAASSPPPEPETKIEVKLDVSTQGVVEDVVEDVVVPDDVTTVESEPPVSPILEETDQTQSVVDSTVLTDMVQNKIEVEASIPPTSVETEKTVEYKPDDTDSSSILSTVIPNNDLNQPPPNNNVHIPKSAYTNSQLNEVQSKGYRRISFNNGHVEAKTPEVTSPEVSDLDEVVEEVPLSSEKTPETVVYEKIVESRKPVTETNCQTNMLNGNHVPPDVEAIISNGDAPVTCFYGDNYNGNGTAEVKNGTDTVSPPPPKETEESPPPKQIPLQKAISIEKEVPVVLPAEQTAESAKDRMIRNIQERGTPCDEKGPVTKPPPTQPVVNNSIRNTINKVIETTIPANKSVEVVDKTNPLFEDVRGTNNRDKPKPLPAVKPKPKPKTTIQNNNNNNNSSSMVNNNNYINNNNKPATFIRNVSEEPGSRQTTNMKTIGSLNIGFARDTSRDVPRTNYNENSRGGTLPRKEPPVVLAKTKMSRSISSDSTGSTESGSSKLSEHVNGGSKISLQNSIDVVDLRSTSARDENLR